MNIFDQYGIKEVADVTIYAIDLDKYDDEIYVPIMYLNTLKVSTLEQTASQSSARGGIGNPELIMWDFGKEITVSIQDALFTPASQSLMWGGKYGIKKPKIYGVWNPYIYPVDEFGRQRYLKRTEVQPTMVQQQQDAWRLLYVQNNEKMFELVLQEDSLNNGDYAIERILEIQAAKVQKTVGNLVDGWIVTGANGSLANQYIAYPDVINDNVTFELRYEDNAYKQRAMTEVDFNPLVFTCPCDGEKKYYLVEQEDGHYKYTRDGKGYVDQLTITEYNCPTDNIINESEEISRAVGKYTIEENQLNNKYDWDNELRPEMAILEIDKFGSFKYHAYEFVSSEDPEDTACYYHDIDLCDESLIKCTSEQIDAYGYIWEDTAITISSLEGLQESFYLDSTDIRYRIRKDNGLREVAIEYHKDYDNNYQPKIDIYKIINQIYQDDSGIEQNYSLKVLIGSFYIIDDWNLADTVPQDFAYVINNGLENVDYLERMEECQAKTTFAIDADKNLRCSNYRYDHAYDQTPLTVFINPRTMLPYEANADSYVTKNGMFLEGNFTIIKQGETYYKWTRSVADEYSSLGHQIIVDAQHYPGVYKIVGETYARARKDGSDQRYQFEIPLCKLSAENNITLEAAGDPTTFSMNFNVLRPDNGIMMKLTQYNVETNNLTGSTTIVPNERVAIEDEKPEWENATVHTVLGPYRADLIETTLQIINPTDNTTQYIDSSEDAPLDGSGAGVLIKADDTYLNTIRTSSPIVYGDVSLNNEVLNDNAQTLLNVDIDKLVVKEVKKYEIYRESHKAYGSGSESDEPIPGTSEWNLVDTVDASHFLLPNEYSFVINDNVISINREAI